MLINDMKDKLVGYGFEEKRAANLIYEYLALFRKYNLKDNEETRELFIKTCEAALIKQKENIREGREEYDDTDAR